MKIDIAVWGPKLVVSHFLKALMENGWEAHASAGDPGTAYAFTVPAVDGWEGGVVDDTPSPSFTVISRDGVIDVDQSEGVNIKFDTDESRRGYRVLKRKTRLQKLIDVHAPSAMIACEKRMLQSDMLLDSEQEGRTGTVAELFDRLMEHTEEDRPEYLPVPGDELAYITATSDCEDPCSGYAAAIIDKYYAIGLRFRVICWNVCDEELDLYYLYYSGPSEEAECKMLDSRHAVGCINGPEWCLRAYEAS